MSRFTLYNMVKRGGELRAMFSAAYPDNNLDPLCGFPCALRMAGVKMAY